MGIFNSYYDPPDEEHTCLLCGNFADDCICPECIICGKKGYKECYTKHGLFMMHYQTQSLIKKEKEWEQDFMDRYNEIWD